MTTELLPCPAIPPCGFCQHPYSQMVSTEERGSRATWFHRVCSDCGARTAKFTSEDQAERFWAGRRASPPAPAPAPEPSNKNWWCPHCQIEVPGDAVTFHETHDPRCIGGCGYGVLLERPVAPAPSIEGDDNCPVCGFPPPPEPTADHRERARLFMYDVPNAYAEHVTKLASQFAAVADAATKAERERCEELRQMLADLHKWTLNCGRPTELDDRIKAAIRGSK